MTRSEAARIQDILLAISAIELAAAYLAKAEGSKSLQSIVLDAVTFRLLTIGEAAKSLPESVLKEFPLVPWREVIRLRDRIGHHYYGLNSEEIWRITQGPLAELRAALERHADF